MTPDLSDRLFAQRALLRALANRLRSRRPFATLVSGHAAAVALVVEVFHDNRCPDCASADWQPWGSRHIRCAACGVRPVFRGSPFAGRKLEPLRLLAAVHAIHVDTATPNAHAFARAWGSTPTCALELFHEVRGALKAMVPPNPAVVEVVLGGCNGANACVVAVSDDDNVSDRLVAFHVDVPGPKQPRPLSSTSRPARHVALWLGRLRHWLSEHFRGVSRKHLWLYLAEFSDRHARVRALA